MLTHLQHAVLAYTAVLRALLLMVDGKVVTRIEVLVWHWQAGCT